MCIVIISFVVLEWRINLLAIFMLGCIYVHQINWKPRRILIILRTFRVWQNLVKEMLNRDSKDLRVIRWEIHERMFEIFWHVHASTGCGVHKICWKIVQDEPGRYIQEGNTRMTDRREIEVEDTRMSMQHICISTSQLR